MLSLADYFLREVSSLWQQPDIRVDLRDFIFWIGMHITLHTPIRQHEGDGGSSLIERIPNPQQDGSSETFDPNHVRRWAHNFAHCLKEKEKEVFRLRFGEGWSLGRIAEELGYKSSSGPHATLDKALEKLRMFMRDLPWLAPDDLMEEAFMLFQETLLAYLKKSVRTP